MDKKTVLYERIERVAIITLNRPEKLNALNGQLLAELEQEMLRADRDQDVRVIIIKGAGRSFSTGMDLEPDGNGTWFAADAPRDDGRTGFEALRESIQETARRWFRMLWQARKPVIAQVHGHCLALASELALMSDMTIVADDAQIGYPASKIHGPAGAFYYLWFAGIKKGREMMLMGDSISGLEAERVGLANRAFPLERLEAETLAIAQKMACTSVEILTLTKQTANRIVEQMGFKTSIEWGLEVNTLAYYTEFSKRWDDLIREKGIKYALERLRSGVE